MCTTVSQMHFKSTYITIGENLHKNRSTFVAYKYHSSDMKIEFSNEIYCCGGVQKPL